LLGIQIEQREGVVSIHQQKYLKEILRRFHMEDCKGNNTPAEIKGRNEGKENILEEKVPYLEAVGALNYLAVCTRPDISFSVQQVARKMHSPTSQDWTKVKRIFQYLNKTKNMKLVYNSKEGISGYSDASYAPKSTERKSISGYVFMKGGGAISWRSKKQPIISLSSMEAEYIGLTSAIQEALWLRKLNEDFSNYEKIIINEDNQSTIKLTENPINNDRSKHIDVRFHFIKERLDNKIMTLKYCPTQEMVADTFTKGLGRILFEKFNKKMGLVDTSN
jgi:uncharacterized protein YlaN (UPF0358 family)